MCVFAYRVGWCSGTIYHMTTTKALADRATEILRAYLSDHRTDHLRELAEIVVELRGAHTLEDGRADWSGRSPAYRQTMADIYARAKVPAENLDTVQAALRYHVGNLLRQRATGDDLEAVGLSRIAPSQRLATRRQALQAQAAVAAPRQDIARLTAYAQALLDFVDVNAVPELAPERAVASRLALEAVRQRAEELLGLLGQQPTRRGGDREQGRHRLQRA